MLTTSNTHSTTSLQCDQKVRLFFDIWPFVTMKISQKCHKLAKVGQVLRQVGARAESLEVDVDLEGRLGRQDTVVFAVENGRLGGELGRPIQGRYHHLRGNKEICTVHSAVGKKLNRHNTIDNIKP